MPFDPVRPPLGHQIDLVAQAFPEPRERLVPERPIAAFQRQQERGERPEKVVGERQVNAFKEKR